MTEPLDIDAIEAEHKVFVGQDPWKGSCSTMDTRLAVERTDALIAEVRRLRDLARKAADLDGELQRIARREALEQAAKVAAAAGNIEALAIADRIRELATEPQLQGGR